jgi:16S rRNA (adenine1518-N6/adenine1519-N6)-dimethyltransferase
VNGVAAGGWPLRGYNASMSARPELASEAVTSCRPPGADAPPCFQAPGDLPTAPARQPRDTTTLTRGPATVLRQLGLYPRKRLSQSFLVDRRIAEAIGAAAALAPADTVLEIGPGLGLLTAALVRRAGRVIAVELDAQLAAALPGLLGHPPNLTVVHGDALALDPAALVPADYKVVANLPYHITSPLLRHLLATAHRPRRLVVMVQREVAERITAPPGQWSYLTVLVQLYAAPRLVRVVPPGAFYPRPKVESAVLALEVYPAPRVAATAPEVFLQVVQAGFKQPRKQLRNSLAEGLGCSPAEAAALLRRAQLDPARRPQTLTLPEWDRLYQVVHDA